MRHELDRTEQRILGVLVEKELTVPESYPLTLNSLVAACNQKSNRDPITTFEEFEIEGAITSLCLKDWVARREGSRATKFVHNLDRRLALGLAEKAILTELLVRGPQTPMELKTRIARMGAVLDADAVEARLAELAARPDGALVELLPRRARERDARWRHLLGPAPVDQDDAATSRAPDPSPVVSRLDALEARVAELERRLDALTRA